MKFSSVYNNGLFHLQTSPPQATCLVSWPQTPWGLSSPALYVCCHIIKNPLHKSSSLTMASESGKWLEEQELYPPVDTLYLSLLALITVFVFSFFLWQKNLCWQHRYVNVPVKYTVPIVRAVGSYVVGFLSLATTRHPLLGTSLFPSALWWCGGCYGKTLFMKSQSLVWALAWAF